MNSARHEIIVKAGNLQIPAKDQVFYFEVNLNYHFEKENHHFHLLKKIVKKNARSLGENLSIQELLTKSLDLVTRYPIGEPVSVFSATEISKASASEAFPAAIKASKEENIPLIFGYSSPMMVDGQELEIPRVIWASVVSFVPSKDRLTVECRGEIKSYRYSKITWLAKSGDFTLKPRVVRYLVFPLANGKLKFVAELFESYDHAGIEFARRRGGGEPFELPPEKLPRKSKLGVDMEFLKSCLDKRVELRDGVNLELFRLSGISCRKNSSSVTLIADNGTKFSVNLERIELEQQ